MSRVKLSSNMPRDLPEVGYPPDNEHAWELGEPNKQGARKWFYRDAGNPKLRIYASGAKYLEGTGRQRGHLVAAPPNALINPDNAQLLHEAKRDKRLNAIREGQRLAIADKRKVNPSSLPEGIELQSIGYGLQARVEDRYSAQGVAAARLLMEAHGDLPDKRATGSSGEHPPGTVTLTVTTTLADLRRQQAAKYGDARVARDAQVVDAVSQAAEDAK